MLDAERFPRLARFVAQMPDGMASHPRHMAKASMYRNLADDAPLSPEDLSATPDVVRALLEDPVPVSMWIPEVHSHAVMLALYDRHFGGLDEFGAYAYRQGKALLRGPLYAIAFKVVSPSFLLKTATWRWQMFHRGTDLAVNSTGSTGARARIEHPEGLFEPVTLRGFCEGIRAALDMCTTSDCVVEVVDNGPTFAEIDLSWN